MKNYVSIKLIKFLFLIVFFLSSGLPVRALYQEDKVPSFKPKYAEHKVEKGDNIASIAKFYKVKSRILKGYNKKKLKKGAIVKFPFKYIRGKTARKFATAVIVARKDGFYMHQTQKKETFASISKHYGISSKKLKKSNPDINIKKLKPGTEIQIPYKYLKSDKSILRNLRRKKAPVEKSSNSVSATNSTDDETDDSSGGQSYSAIQKEHNELIKDYTNELYLMNQILTLWENRIKTDEVRLKDRIKDLDEKENLLAMLKGEEVKTKVFRPVKVDLRKHYLVIASFQKMNMAQEKVLDLSKHGFTPFVLNTKNNEFAVCLDKFTTKDKAEREKKALIKVHPFINIWTIYE